MEAEAPVRLHGRQADSTGLVLFGDLFLSGTVEEIEIYRSSKCAPSQVSRKHESLHGVGAALVDTVAPADVVALRAGILRCDELVRAVLLVNLVVPSVEIERVIAVDVA